MKYKTLLLSFLLTLTFNLKAQTSLLSTVNAMTNQQVWDALLNANLNGETIFGKCALSDATQCQTCACDYYFRSAMVGTLGKYGYPKNPASGDSTGCNNGTRWGGYTAAMATPDLKANARAMLVLSLTDNKCGTIVTPPVIESISDTDTGKILFVNPSQNGGKVMCGSTQLGPQVGSLVQFSKFSEDFCLPAYYSARKTEHNGGAAVQYITTQQYYNYEMQTATISAAAAAAVISNQSFNLLTMSLTTGANQVNIQALVDANLDPTSAVQAYTAVEIDLLRYAIESAGENVPTTSKLSPATVTSATSSRNLRRSATSTVVSADPLLAQKNSIDLLFSKEVVGKSITTLEQAVLQDAPGPAL